MVEAFHPDVIQIDAPVHARARCGLGHDQELRFFQELADFRRDRHELIAAAQKPHLRRPQQTETGLEFGFERFLAVGVAIVTRAEQGEIVGSYPLQKLDGFGDLFGGQRRRIGLQFRGNFGGARQHRPPIGNGNAHIGEYLFQRSHDLRALRFVVHAGNMNVNETFAASFASARPLERG